MIDDALFDDSLIGGSIEIEEDMLFDGTFFPYLADDATIFSKASSESQREETWVQEVLFDEDEAYLLSGNAADCSFPAPGNVTAPNDEDFTDVATVVSASSSGNSSTSSTQRSEQTQEYSRVSSEKLDECMKQSARSRSLIDSLMSEAPGKQAKSVFIRSMVSAWLSSSSSLSKRGSCQNTAASGTTHKTSTPKNKRSSGLVKCRIGAHMKAVQTSKKKNMLKRINSANSGLGQRHLLARCSSAKVKTTGMLFRSVGGTSSLGIKLPVVLPRTPQKSSTHQQQQEMKTTTISDFLRIKKQC